ncbi:hypothetical protein ILYODFUR_004052 [Ilyodon furcidens]|uniref:Uncharacterized protein n=1 Tax=Ilyodon furcidens TaxID=33524 RepID=A0ABV0U5F0_9TELE
MIQKYGKRSLFPSQNRWRISCTLEVTATKTRVGSKRQNGWGGAGACLQQSTGERRGTPWTGSQSITGQHRDTRDKQPSTHPFTPKGN